MKAAIAAALATAGAVAAIWGAQNLPLSLDQPSAARAARNLGVVALAVGGLATANYLYALFLVRRMRRGEDVIGRWTVAPATFARFRETERSRSNRKNNWRIPRGNWPEGLPVIFSSDAVLVGDSWFRLASKGMSRFTYARIEQDAVPFVEFAMTLTVAGAGTQGRTARYRGHLRIPIADHADIEAARVVGHFRQMV